MRPLFIACAALFLLLVHSACDLNAADSADGGVSCGSATCTSTQVCVYRECNATERCQVATQCPASATPTTCNGQPGCLLAQCGPVVQGCRDIPATCKGDVTCACGSICGDAGACAKVDGKNIDCSTP